MDVLEGSFPDNSCHQASVVSNGSADAERVAIDEPSQLLAKGESALFKDVLKTGGKVSVTPIGCVHHEYTAWFPMFTEVLE